MFRMERFSAKFVDSAAKDMWVAREPSSPFSAHSQSPKIKTLVNSKERQYTRDSSTQQTVQNVDTSERTIRTSVCQKSEMKQAVKRVL